MKLFNTITACLLLCAGLVSCEMKGCSGQRFAKQCGFACG